MTPAAEHYSAPLLWLLAPYALGLMGAAAGAGVAPPLALGLALLLSGAALAVCWRDAAPRPRRPWLWGVLLATAAALGGVVRMQGALDPGGAAARWHGGLPSREVTLDVQVTRLFPAGDDDQRQLCLGRVVAAPPPLEVLVGQRVSFGINRGSVAADVIVRSAVWRTHALVRRLEPGSVSRGSFEEYLVRAGVGFILDRARVEAVTTPPTRLHRFLHRANQRFDAILRHGLPENHPATGVYVAMFLGRKSELSDAQKQSYLRSGTMHLFAISGLHIAMIAFCLGGLFAVLRVPRRVAATLGLVALWIFVEATGGTPSARRAFLLVAFLWAGGVLQRPANPLASLVASALLVLVWDPLALLSASFQLSYAVVAALLLYGLPLARRWLTWWQPWSWLPQADWRQWQWLVFFGGRKVLGVTALSCAATLISTPLSLDYFQVGSPGAVLSNIVLMPVTSGAIAAAFASLVCGLCGATALSTIFNHAGALILAAVDVGARLAAQMPGMFFEGMFSAGWMAPVIVLTLLALLVAGYARGWSRLPGRWWTPPVVLVALVVFLVTPGGARQESAPMKSAYELAMERLKKSDPASGPELTAEQKTQLADIDRVYQGRIAEREIFLKQRLAEAQAAGQHEELEKIRQQMSSERARLEEEREDEKNRIRRAAGGGK